MTVDQCEQYIEILHIVGSTSNMTHKDRCLMYAFMEGPAGAYDARFKELYERIKADPQYEGHQHRPSRTGRKTEPVVASYLRPPSVGEPH